MLQKDKKRLAEIHQEIGSLQTPYTKSGKLLYYFDANAGKNIFELDENYYHNSGGIFKKSEHYQNLVNSGI